MISFRIDWFHLLAVQGTFKSLVCYDSEKRKKTRDGREEDEEMEETEAGCGTQS